MRLVKSLLQSIPCKNDVVLKADCIFFSCSMPDPFKIWPRAMGFPTQQNVILCSIPKESGIVEIL